VADVSLIQTEKLYTYIGLIYVLTGYSCYTHVISDCNLKREKTHVHMCGA
jgi:hypothetical protein